jgi:SAM-dependent methyltransferase
MPEPVSKLQSEYFSNVKYRDPFHPVVTAYAEPKLKFIRSHIPLNGCILDVGCGNGIFTGRFASCASSVVGLDSSTHLLGQNAHKILVCGDATTLPFEDNRYDIVFEANLLHHVSNRIRVIEEMRRVTRRYVVLLEPNRYNPLMFALSLAVRAERGVLLSSLPRLQDETARAGLRIIASVTTGMISQNNTPESLVPLLKRFDRPIWWGEYIVMIAEKS